jgi:hypothetical protein
MPCVTPSQESLNNDSELLVLHTLLEHGISLLDHVRQSAGIAGLSWEEHYFQQTFIDSIFTASRDNPVYLRPLKTIPRAQVEAEVLAGSQEHKLTAPHLYVRPKEQQQQEPRIVMIERPQDVKIVRDFMSEVLSKLPAKHHSFGLDLLPSFEQLEKTDEDQCSRKLDRTVKLRQHALDLAGYTWPTPASSATAVDLKTGLHRCGSGIHLDRNLSDGGRTRSSCRRLGSSRSAMQRSIRLDSMTCRSTLLCHLPAGHQQFALKEKMDLLAQSNLTGRLLQPMLQFSQRWPPRGVVDEREKRVLRDMLEVCGLSATFGVLEYLQWNSLPVFMFAAELSAWRRARCGRPSAAACRQTYPTPRHSSCLTACLIQSSHCPSWQRRHKRHILRSSQCHKRPRQRLQQNPRAAKQKKTTKLEDLIRQALRRACPIALDALFR